MSKFKPGVSGNPAGRPKGSRNKAMSDKELKDMLGKRTQTCIETIMEMVTDDTEEASITLKFKAANAILGYDFQIRALEYKKLLDKRKERAAKEENNVDTEDYDTPVVSLKAI